MFPRVMREIRTILGSACFALLLSPSHASAQVLIGYLFGEKLASENFNIGFEVGANFSTLDGFASAERVNDAVFGLFGDWRFSEHLHLGGAILPIAGRGAQKLPPAPTHDPAFDAQTAGGTMERSAGIVEIPVLLKWAPRRQEGFRVGIGPSFGIVTGATDRYDAVSPSGSHYVLEQDIDDRLPGLDFGVAVDAEWRLPLLSIAVRYTHGLTDMRLEGSTDAIHSRVLTGTGRIYLGKKSAK
jgi:hypothetical protein